MMASVTRNKKKNIPKSIHEMSKEKLEETLKKKKECNAKAQGIVEALCEQQIDENWFLKNLHFINQSHFEDVTEERAILKLCGYPLCNNNIEKVTKQQYHISTRYNKVFDITERKNFCSSSCYKAANYVKNQLLTSPLWFRDQEIMPKYTILKENKSSLGKEIIFFPDKVSLGPEDKSKATKTMKTFEFGKDVPKTESGNCSGISPSDAEPKETVNTLSNEELKETSLKEDKNVEQEKLNGVHLSDDNTNKNDILDTGQHQKGAENISDNKNLAIADLNNRFEQFSLSEKTKITDSAEDKKGFAKLDKNKSVFKTIKSECSGTTLQKTSKKQEKSNKFLNSVGIVEKAVLEWFTLDTLFYLYGEKKIKKIFKDSSSQIKEVLNSRLSAATYDEKIEKMIKLYGLLDSETFNTSCEKPNLKPLPDYSAIKEESKSLNIKVKAFYSGNLEIKGSVPEGQKKEENGSENIDSENDIYLPLIDSQAQNTLRRKILLDKLGRVLPDLIKVFSTDYVLPMSEIKQLISTFALSAHNITFKPAEWTLVGLILVKLLSLKEKYLNAVFKLESSQEQLKLLLTTCHLQPDFLDSLIEKLTDTKNIIEKFR